MNSPGPCRTQPSRRCWDKNFLKSRMLINILLDAKVDSVTSFRRAPLTEEGETSPTPTPPPAPGRTLATAKPGGTPAPTLIERNVVDVTFKAAPAAARKVVERNRSVDRTVLHHSHAVRAQRKRQRSVARERWQFNAAAKSASRPQASRRAAAALNFIVGNEHIEVSATIEMLRFTF